MVAHDYVLLITRAIDCAGLLGIDYAPSDSDSTPVPAAAPAEDAKSLLVAYDVEEAEVSESLQFV